MWGRDNGSLRDDDGAAAQRDPPGRGAHADRRPRAIGGAEEVIFGAVEGGQTAELPRMAPDVARTLKLLIG